MNKGHIGLIAGATAFTAGGLGVLVGIAIPTAVDEKAETCAVVAEEMHSLVKDSVGITIDLLEASHIGQLYALAGDAEGLAEDYEALGSVYEDCTGQRATGWIESEA